MIPLDSFWDWEDIFHAKDYNIDTCKILVDLLDSSLDSRASSRDTSLIWQ